MASFTNLTNANATLTEVSGTRNWRLDIELTGTFDHDFVVRVRRERLEFNGVDVPAARLDSGTFRVDSSLNDRTVTIATDATDIRLGRAFDVNVVFSAAVTDFVVGDVAITGGTIDAITPLSSTDYDLRVTPTSVGTLTVAIAEDVARPGNVAASEDFSVRALPTAMVMLNPMSLRHGRTARATILWSEVVADFMDTDVSVNVGSFRTSLVLVQPTQWI